MTSVIVKVALATVLTLASLAGLFGLSGMIIFADVKAPQPSSIVENAAARGGEPLTIIGPNR